MVGAQSSPQVAITGASALCSSVIGVTALWDQLIRDQLIDPAVFERSTLAGLAQLSAAEERLLSQQQLLGLAASELAWRQAGLNSTRQPLRGERHPRLRERWRERVGVVSASAFGSTTALLEERCSDPERAAPTSLSRWRGNSLGAVISLRFGLQGEQINLNAASSTGAQALALAGRLIRSGELDRVLVVGAEPALASALVNANLRSGAMAAAPTSRPLTVQRSGMVPREAAGCLILERLDHAQARGGEILALLSASASGCEAHHLMAPQPEQILSNRLLERLLEQAGMSSSKAIDWVCLHATGTRRFDTEEACFLRRSFGHGPWISAMKRSLGHGLGAAGVVEAALISEGLRRGLYPPWPTDLDPSLELPVEPGLEINPAPKCALQCANGMGGVVVMNLLAAVR